MRRTVAAGRTKVFLYCVEVRCPESGWSVPLLPSRVVSKGYRVVAELVPDPGAEALRHQHPFRREHDDELKEAEDGTIGREGRYGEAFLVHEVNGKRYKTKITTLRGDIRQPDGSAVNRVRLWEKDEVVPRPDDLLQERIYCIQWMRPKTREEAVRIRFSYR